MRIFPIVAVVGGSRVDEATARLAEAVGRGLAEAGAALICGGRGGVMEAACRGAAEAGGLTIGILPGEDASEANPWVRLPIATGLREARNSVIARTADALIAIDGRWGTLTEIAYGRHFGKPVVGLGTWRLPDAEHDIQRAGSPAEAVRLALEALQGDRP